MGPATEDDKVLRVSMRSGMAVARFNFSHGDYEMYKKRWNALCACEELDLPIATMLEYKRAGDPITAWSPANEHDLII